MSDDQKDWDQAMLSCIEVVEGLVIRAETLPQRERLEQMRSRFIQMRLRGRSRPKHQE